MAVILEAMTALDQDYVHDVLFAESDDELRLLAGDRVSDSLASGRSAIVISSPDHHEQFLDQVSRAGHDPDRARADGALLMLDAADTLGRMTPSGTFDRDAFDEVVGDLVREQAARGPVFAFGEMVALLFDAGRPHEAIDLEAAWDDLLRETSAELLCAYPGSLLDEPEHAVHVGSVCGMHSGVVAESPFHRSWSLDGDPSAGGVARRLVANALRARGVPEAAFYDTLSVVTELVANAVNHSAGPVSVEIGIDHAAVRLRVGDSSPTAPVIGRAKGGRIRGLRLVEELAHRWGTDIVHAGKVVWVELAR